MKFNSFIVRVPFPIAFIVIIAQVLSLTLPFVSILNAQSLVGNAPVNTNDLAIPNDLKDWVPWVLEGEKVRLNCANSESDKYQCQYPGKIDVTVNDFSGNFKISADVLNESYLPLPFSKEYPIHNLKVIDKKGRIYKPFLSDNGSIKLPSGSYVITLDLKWDRMPEILPIPRIYGIVKVVNSPKLHDFEIVRTNSGISFRKKIVRDSQDSLSVEVSRLVQDGLPLTLTTLISIESSGSARTINFGDVLPKGAIPVSVTSKLPAHLSDKDGLTIQLLPGRHWATIYSSFQQPVKELEIPVVSNPFWPKNEVVSFKRNNKLRKVNVDGGKIISADLLKIPAKWKSGRIAQFKGGDSLVIETKEKKDNLKIPSKFSLTKELWINDGGDSLTVKDYLSGQAGSLSRINISGKQVLERASMNQKPWLITLDPKTGSSGLEVRTNSATIEGISKFKGINSVDANGWDVPLVSSNVTLHLPPAWRLFNVSGVQNDNQSWIGKWSLIRLFLLSLLVIFTSKIFGNKVGLLLLLSLVFSHGEFLAPVILFVYIVVLDFIRRIISKEAPYRSFLVGGIWLTFSLWFLHVLSFLKLQLTQLLFPQLQSGTRFRTLIQGVLLTLENTYMLWGFILLTLFVAYYGIRLFLLKKKIFSRILISVFFGGLFLVMINSAGFYLLVNKSYRQAKYIPRPEADLVAQSALNMGSRFESYSNKLYKGKSTSARNGLKNNISREEVYQNKLIKTGVALPSWKWHNHRFAVNGPIDSNVKINFSYISPGIQRFLSLIRLLVTGLLLIVMLGKLRKETGLSSTSIDEGSTVGVVNYGFIFKVLVVLIATFTVPLKANALPSKKMNISQVDAGILDELRNRLKSKLTCKKKPCTSIENISVYAGEDKLKLVFKVVSDFKTSFAIPGPINVFQPNKVLVDGKESTSLRRNSSGFLEVAVSNGFHIVEAIGELKKGDVTSLKFSSTSMPKSANFFSDDWDILGIGKSGILKKSISIVKKSEQVEQKSQKVISKVSELEPWLYAKRFLEISDRGTSTISISRKGSEDREVKFKLNSISGERVLSNNAIIKEGKLIATLPEGAKSLTINTAFELKKNFKLRSLDLANAKQVSEEWQVRCAAYVQCGFSGINKADEYVGRSRIGTWYPFPEQEVNISLAVLKGIAGKSLSIDKVNHFLNYKGKVVVGAVNLSLRASSQSKIDIQIEGASIKNASLNSVSSDVEVKNDKTSAIVKPGSSMLKVTYSYLNDKSSKNVVPKIILSHKASNIYTTITPNRTMWQVWTSGKGWGPSVLFWAKLIVLIAISVALVKLGIIELTLFGAVAFGFGMSLLPLVFSFIPYLWLGLVSNKLEIANRLNGIPKFLKGLVFGSVSLLTLFFIYKVIYLGLMQRPPMLVAGNGSTISRYIWYVQSSDVTLPIPYFLEFPMWIWRSITFFWAIWITLLVTRKSTEYYKGASAS